jgi:hypothetical protein
MLKNQSHRGPRRPRPRRLLNRNRIRKNWLFLTLIGLVALGAFGSGLNYLREDAARRSDRGGPARNGPENSALDAINPFLAPTPAARLSKGYVYAGSRLPAVENAGSPTSAPAGLAVWRRSTGTWRVMGGAAGSQPMTQYRWALGGIPVQGDFDGDGKTDFSIFRPSGDQWRIPRSGDGTYGFHKIGAAGDRRAPADSDGGWMTGPAMFHPSTGVWHMLGSRSNSATSRQFGSSSDTPCPRDFDGDGKADIADWRPTSGAFHSILSRSGETRAERLPGGGEPVSADYDGDGRADLAVRNGADWMNRCSSTGSLNTTACQSAGDISVPNDCDGDGRTDVARQHVSGAPGDIPVSVIFPTIAYSSLTRARRGQMETI